MLTTEGRVFEFPEPSLAMFTLTCVNHPLGRWSTKHAYERNVHWLGWMDAAGHVSGYTGHPEFGYRECDCPFGDLRVVESRDDEAALSEKE